MMEVGSSIPKPVMSIVNSIHLIRQQPKTFCLENSFLIRFMGDHKTASTIYVTAASGENGFFYPTFYEFQDLCPCCQQ
jgi:hypothetical protein